MLSRTLGPSVAPWGGTTAPQKQARALRNPVFGLSFWQKTDEYKVLASQLVRNEGASSAFYDQVIDLLVQKVPLPFLKAVQADGYRFLTKRYVTQGRPDLDKDLNLAGGLNEPMKKQATIAETVFLKVKEPPSWEKSLFWENAVVHEMGHALADILGRRMAQTSILPQGKAEAVLSWGASELEAFKKAWKQDVAQLPAEMKKPDSRLAYFLSPGVSGRHELGRRETFAEGVDILIRGEASTFNEALFRQHFSRTLRALQRLLEKGFSAVLPFGQNGLKKQ